MVPGTPDRIAIALTGAIGDVILSTPLVEAVRRAYPAARLTYIVGEKSAPVLQGLPLIDERMIMSDGKFGRFFSAAGLFGSVLRRRFDLSICLTRSDRLALIFCAARVPCRVGFTPLRAAWALTVPIDAYAEPHHSSHRTGYFLAAAAALGIAAPEKVRLWYRVSDEERQKAALLLRGRGANPGSEDLIAIHPGTSPITIEKRRWPVERFADVARHFAQNGCRVILLGGPDEVEMSGGLARSLGNAAIDFSGQLSIRDSAAVLERCRVLIHNDSAPLHLAGALGVPVVAIFGYQNPRLWGPVDPRSRVVRRDLPCSPCDQDFPCDRSFECIRNLPSPEVIAAVETVLEAAKTLR